MKTKGENVFRIFGDDKHGDALYHQIAEEFSEHLSEGGDLEEVCRNYIGIGARAWVEKIGREAVREEILELAVALDEWDGQS